MKESCHAPPSISAWPASEWYVKFESVISDRGMSHLEYQRVLSTYKRVMSRTPFLFFLACQWLGFHVRMSIISHRKDFISNIKRVLSTYERDMSRTPFCSLLACQCLFGWGIWTSYDENKRFMSHIWMGHVPHTDKSCHTCEWVVSLTAFTLFYMPVAAGLTYMNGFCPIYEWVTSNKWLSQVPRKDGMSHVPHKNEWFSTNVWVLSHAALNSFYLPVAAGLTWGGYD